MKPVPSRPDGRPASEPAWAWAPALVDHRPVQRQQRCSTRTAASVVVFPARSTIFRNWCLSSNHLATPSAPTPNRSHRPPWEAWGEACVPRFRGMFAFALWDASRNPVRGARPLRRQAAVLRFPRTPLNSIFGSELKSLMVHPLARDIDPLAVEEYFAYGYVPEPRTIFKRACKLPPGFTLTLKRGEARALPKQYWDMPFTPVKVTDEAGAMDELVERMQESIRLRMIADVPLGAFLSVASIPARWAMMHAVGHAGEHLLDRFDSRLQRNRIRTEGRRPLQDESTTSRPSPPTTSPGRQARRRVRRTYADSSALPTTGCANLRASTSSCAVGDAATTFRRYRATAVPLRERMRAVCRLRCAVRFWRAWQAVPQADWRPSIPPNHLRGAGATRSKVIFTASRCCPTRSVASFTPAFKRDLQVTRRGSARRHAAVAPTKTRFAGAVSRHQNLPVATSSPGRPRQHGACARSARAAARS